MNPDTPYYRRDLALIHHRGFGFHADACARGILGLLERVLASDGLVVEIGCGSGLLTRHLIDAGHRVMATDASPAMLDLARQVAGDAESIRELVLPDDPKIAAGTVCIWEHTWNGESISEIGWMVLPVFQGRGLASAAVGETLSRARSQARWGVVHAFPAINNAASNAICRKTGFSKVEACDYEYSGRILHCNHWLVDLRTP